MEPDPAAVTQTPTWPLAVYLGAVMLLVAAMLGLSYLLGERHRARAKDVPYEGGVVSTGTAQIRFAPQYYLVAILFVVFDLEAAFLIAWSVAVRPLGWLGFTEVAIFIAVLGAALFYLWRGGALSFVSGRRTVT